MNTAMKIDLANGERVWATYVRHLRTLTSGNGCTSGGNRDLDLFRLADGREIVCESPSNNGKATPWEVEDMTANNALFA